METLQEVEMLMRRVEEGGEFVQNTLFGILKRMIKIMLKIELGRCYYTRKYSCKTGPYIFAHFPHLKMVKLGVSHGLYFGI